MSSTQKVFYRIHTEDKDGLPALVAKYFDCFNVVKGTGYWCGKPEESATVEVISDVSDELMVILLARRICEVNEQDAVYVTSHPVDLTDVRVRNA